MGNNAFKNYDKVYALVESSYRKLKTYFYYDNTLIFMKNKIAEVEYNKTEFELFLSNVTNVLVNPRRKNAIDSINRWLESINFYILPKNFKNINNSLGVVTNINYQDSAPDKVNFYIDAPLELHVLDLIWCMYIGKFSKQKELFSSYSYAYKFHNHLFYNTSNLLECFNLKSNWLFERYYDRYSIWRDNAIDKINSRYKNGKNSLLISLDIKNYYYAIRFNFKQLEKLLLDTQYVQIKNLTNIIENCYIKYSKILSNYRSDVSLNDNEVILPIGLLSSGVISNLYLNKLDENIKKNLNPIYYGRYVDDVLILLNSNNKDRKNYSLRKFIKQVLISNGILLEKEKNNYTLKYYNELSVQKDKIRVLYIDSKSPKSILDMIYKDIKFNSSEANLLPDVINGNLFNHSAYKYEKNDIVTKLQDLDVINKDNFNAIKFITNQLWKKQNVIVNKDEKYKSELKQISSFFSGNVALELYASWTKIFTYYLINKEQKCFKSFYEEMANTITNLKFKSICDINYNKKQEVLTKLKETMFLCLNIAKATASALDIKYLEKNIDKSIIELTKKLRKSNLFNHHYMSYPMINYTKIAYDIEVSLLEQNIEYYSSKFKELESELDSNRDSIADKFLIKYSPKFIHLEEFYILSFIKKIHGHGWKLNNKVAAWYFKELNLRSPKEIPHGELPFVTPDLFNKDTSIALKQDSCDKNFTTIMNLERYLVHEYAFNNYTFYKNSNGKRCLRRDVKEEIRIALGNVNIRDSQYNNQLINGKSNNTYEKKIKLYGFLKSLLEYKADILIMPELYVPIAWLNELAVFSRKTQKALIFGLEYIVNRERAHNHIVTIIPSVTISGFKMASVLIREKNNYSSIEAIELAEHKLICKDQYNPTYILYKWKGIDFTCFNCFEMTDIVARSIFKSRIDILFAVEYNKDTNYFSSIVDSMTRDLHCFIVQSNISKYGDSRITSPKKTELKDILKIKGGDNESVLIGTINVKELKDFQSSYESKLKQKIEKAKTSSKKKMKKDRFKPLPANYVSRS